MKEAIKSKTILFFILMILYTIIQSIIDSASANAIIWTEVNWSAMFAAVMGIVLRFMTNQPIKLK